jgi:2-oxoglutarate ferredoxin oxidoreductase subunit beta
MRVRTEPLIFEYLRGNKKFPTVWCPGCGNGIVLSAIARAVADLGLDKSKIAMVSGIGCSGRMPAYIDFCTLHTTHGRALAFATGLKLVKPEMKILVVMGDGDSLAIGGNHFIHTARRNMDLTAIVINNQIYGMTGGQLSPTAPTGSYSSTSTYGNVDQPFDISKMAEVSGASFVARSTVYHVYELKKFITQAILKRGFSVVEVLSNCHTYFGRLNKIGNNAPQMLKWFRDNTVLDSAPPEKKAGKFTRGILINRDLPSYLERYQEALTKAQRAVSERISGKGCE